MKQVLIIDCQILQSSDKRRGMGYYLTSLLSKLKDQSTYSIKLIISDQLPKIDNETESLLNSIGEIVKLSLKAKSSSDKLYLDAYHYNQRVISSYIDQEEDIDKLPIFYIPALFSHEIYPVFPSSGLSKNFVLCHDIIPYLYPDVYFSDRSSDNCTDYLQRHKSFYQADLYLTNSNTTAQDLAQHIGVPPEVIVPILGGGADRSSLSLVKPESIDKNLKKLILMPSGDDFRKNNLIAAKAFKQFNTTNKGGYKLLITSKFSEGSKKELSAISKDIIFLGDISGEEYNWCIENSSAVLFPTLYEGLGMPILEAMAASKPIACSDIAVFNEIANDNLWLFNPKSIDEMAKAINKAVSLEKIDQQTANTYKDALDKYNWENTAKNFLVAIEKLNTLKAQNKNKPLIAIATPNPESYSAIGIVTMHMHAELSKKFDIDYYFEDGTSGFGSTRLNLIRYAGNNSYPASELLNTVKRGYAQIIYHIANSEFHINSILSALKIPGIVILHDTRLNGIYDLMRGSGIITVNRDKVEDKLSSLAKEDRSKKIVSIVNNQRLIICHSNYSKHAVKHVLIEKNSPKIVKAELPVKQLIWVPKVGQTKKVVVSFAGIMSSDKGLNLVSEIAQMDNVTVKIFGFVGLGEESVAELKRDNVKIMRNLSDKDYLEELTSTDILVNFRENYNGETSLSTLEAMRLGVAVIVNDIGWYSELPNEVVLKVKDSKEIEKTILNLANKRADLDLVSKKAFNFIKNNHGLSQYVKIIESNV